MGKAQQGAKLPHRVGSLLLAMVMHDYHEHGNAEVKTAAVYKQVTFVFERWSTTRPGVPTMMCGLLPRAIAWAIMSMPPTKTAHLTPIPAPNASNCSAICSASSRVGESTRAKLACGVSRSSWKSHSLDQSTALVSSPQRCSPDFAIR